MQLQISNKCQLIINKSQFSAIKLILSISLLCQEIIDFMTLGS